MVDLEAALGLETAVVNFMTATQDRDLSALQHNLSVLRYKRYLCLSELDDLEAAIRNGEASISSTPMNHPAIGTRQDTTAVYHFDRFKLVGCRADLDAAVIYGEASLASATPEETSTLARRRENLAQYYHASYNLSNSLADLEVVLKYRKLIIEALPSGDPSLPECHRILALLNAECFRRSGDLNNFDCALKHTKFNSETQHGGFLFWPQGYPLPWKVSPHLITSGIANICAGLVSLLSDDSRYRALLEHKGLVAQEVLDLMQMVLDHPQMNLDPTLKNNLMTAMLRLSRKSLLYPRCFTLREVEQDYFPVAAGHFGDIFKGKFCGLDVCLKVIKMYETSRLGDFLKAFSREAIVWGQVSHTNILPFYGVYHLSDNHGRICLVSPWMVNGNIKDYLESHRQQANLLLLISDIVQGISYLHENNIIHGDLKGVNILVTEGHRACVADFGLSTVNDREVLRWTSMQSTMESKGGTIRWQAPEIIHPPSDEDSYPTRESDIYAFACVCYEILTGRLPFHEISSEVTVMFKVMSGLRPSHPSALKDTLQLYNQVDLDLMWPIIEDCWQPEPTRRPSAPNIISRISIRQLEDTRLAGDWGPLNPARFRNTTNVVKQFFSCADINELINLEHQSMPH